MLKFSVRSSNFSEMDVCKHAVFAIYITEQGENMMLLLAHSGRITIIIVIIILPEIKLKQISKFLFRLADL